MVKKKRVVKREKVGKGFTRRTVSSVPMDVHQKFANYEERVDRLQQLEKQLRILDPVGFSTETKVIKSKLKDPSAVQELEELMDDIQRKMLIKSKEEREHTKEKTPVHKKKIEKIHNEAKKFKKKLHHKKVNSNVNAFVEGRYKKFMGALKDDLTEQEKSEGEELKIRLKKRFLEEEKRLGRQHKNKMEELQKKYDEDVKNHLQAEVNSRFDKKIHETLIKKKIQIEQRYALQNKKLLEEEIDEQRGILRGFLKKEFNANLQKVLDDKKVKLNDQKKNFYGNVFNDIHAELEKEVKDKEDALRKRFHKELVENTRKNVESQKRRLQHEFRAKFKSNSEVERQRLQDIFDMKVKDIEKKLDDQKAKLKVKHEGFLATLNEGEEAIEVKKQELRRRADAFRTKEEFSNVQTDKLKKKLDNERKDLKKKEEEFEKNKAGLQEEFVNRGVALEERFNLIKNQEEVKFLKEKENLKQKLLTEMNKRLKESVGRETALIGQKLQKEFRSKVREEISKQKDLTQRSLELNKRVNDKKIRELKGEAYEKEKALVEVRNNLMKQMGLEKERSRLLIFRANRSEEQVKVESDLKIKEMSEKLHRELRSKLENKERGMKARLEKDFNLKLQRDITHQRSDLEKRRVALASDLQKHVGSLLN